MPRIRKAIPGVDRKLLVQDAAKLMPEATRRAFLRGGLSVGALTLDRPLLAIGAVLFLTSDALLATERFLLSAVSPHRAWLRQLVWILYYVAQATICLSVLL